VLLAESLYLTSVYYTTGMANLKILENELLQFVYVICMYFHKNDITNQDVDTIEFL